MTQALSDVLRATRAWPIFAFYVLATLTVAVVIALMTVNVIDLGMDHFGDATHRSHDVAYGLLFTTLVVGVLAQVRRPERNVAAMVMSIVPPAALLFVGVRADQVDRVFEYNPLRYGAAVAAVVLLLHPSGRGFTRSFRAARISWPMLGLVGVAAVPLLGFASTNITQQRTVIDVHALMGHFGFMAALSYTVIAVGVLASLRPVGWRLTAWVAGLLPALLGITSLLYPDAVSSLDTAWSLAAVVWGLAFIALATQTPDAGTIVPRTSGDGAIEPQPRVGSSTAPAGER